MRTSKNTKYKGPSYGWLCSRRAWYISIYITIRTRTSGLHVTVQCSRHQHNAWSPRSLILLFVACLLIVSKFEIMSRLLLGWYKAVCRQIGSTVNPRKLNGLILEQLETRTKNSRKIRFEIRIKIRKSNHERGIAQHRAAHAHLTRKSNKLKVEPPLGTDCVRLSRVHCSQHLSRHSIEFYKIPSHCNGSL
jgi:hypothetical protein